MKRLIFNRMFVIIILLTKEVLSIGQEGLCAIPSDSSAGVSTGYRMYGALVHQHLQFVHKAFSYQGVEAGVILSRSSSMGAYYSTFANNLEVKMNDQPTFIYSWKAGINVAKWYNVTRKINIGGQLSAGYFVIRTDENKIRLWSGTSSSQRQEGLLLSPSVYGEWQICDWFKFRTGLAYSFFQVLHKELQNNSIMSHGSMDFGFLFLLPSNS